MGDVVLTELLKDRNLIPKIQHMISAYVQITDETMRYTSLGLIQRLRQAGIATEYPLINTKPEKQFKRAVELSAKWIIAIESDNQVTIKNLRTREEQVCLVEDVTDFLELNN